MSVQPANSTTTTAVAKTVVTKTTCPYCGVGCGVLIEKAGDKVEVKGDPDHPANFGRLCSKGSALGETVALDGSLLEPRIHGKSASWDDALDVVASRFSATIAEHGPDSVAFYVSGQLLTEDYYVINKLAKGFVGTANIDTNSRLCMASSVAGHKRAFGSDTVPGCYEDLEEADLIVLVGSNAAWCHPVLFQRMMAAKEKNPDVRVVVIDPRRTQTCEGADLHLPLRSGSDAVLFNGLLSYLNFVGQRDQAFIAQHTSGIDAALAATGIFDIAQIARTCGLPEGSVQLFFNWFGKTRKVVTLYSQGINHSSSGTDKVNAIINCHLITGRIGHPGMGPFSLTGQPNAMGGREVGGLANQLAAHLEIENPDHRAMLQRFWNAPNIAHTAGLKAVDMFQAVESGKIKAIWIMSTNPLVSMPDANRVRKALELCPLVVVSDVLEHTDTGDLAHVLLPATAWGEKSGTVTNSERRISRQRPFLPAPGQARADWDVVCEVARRMGFSGFEFATPSDVFKEHAALSAFENNGTRDFDISGLSTLGIDAYDDLAPVQWPVSESGAGLKRFFADGLFFTSDQKARFVPISPRAPQNKTATDYPMVLNTGRVRDQWHTMTRTGKSPRLAGHVFEPYAEFNPEDASRLNLIKGGFTRLFSAYGSMIARVRIETGQRRGCVFVPMHWSMQYASDGLINALVNPVVDPVSGQPESKHTSVKAESFVPLWQAVIFSAERIAPPKNTMWVTGLSGNAHRMELWGEHMPADWDAFAAKLLTEATANISSYRDAAAGKFRYFTTRDAKAQNSSLNAALFVSLDEALPSRSWVSGLFAAEELTASARMSLLAGAPLEAASDIGELVCSCFSIGRNQIDAAIKAGCTTVQALGERIKAGTNCGSCKPELAKMLGQGQAVQAARPNLVPSN